MLEQQSGTGTSQRRPPARKQERVQKGEVKMITSTGPKRQAIYVQPMAPQPYFVPQNSQPGSQTGQAQPVTGGNAHPRCTEQRTKEVCVPIKRIQVSFRGVRVLNWWRSWNL